MDIYIYTNIKITYCFRARIIKSCLSYEYLFCLFCIKKKITEHSLRFDKLNIIINNFNVRDKMHAMFIHIEKCHSLVTYKYFHFCLF